MSLQNAHFAFVHLLWRIDPSFSFSDYLIFATVFESFLRHPKREETILPLQPLPQASTSATNFQLLYIWKERLRREKEPEGKPYEFDPLRLSVEVVQLCYVMTLIKCLLKK